VDVTAEAAAVSDVPASRAGAAGIVPEAPEAAGAGEPRIFVASQRQLMWWKFRKHRPAVAASIVVALAYLVALFVEPLAPFTTDYTSAVSQYAPPQRVHVFDHGQYVGPYVYGLKQQLDSVALRRNFVVDTDTRIPLGFFVHGQPYKLWGLFPMDVHVFGPLNKDDRAYLLGADRLGRDVLSRLIYGTRISLSIGLLGVLLSFVFGLLFGGISGYYGGWIDEVIQRVIEFLRSVPTIPLWMGFAALVPNNWPPVKTYFTITLILSLVGWTGLARVVRGRFLSLREEDFVTAARLDGATEMRTIFGHMLPSFTSHIIAAITLAIPGVILAETALSFLGVGLQPPVVSWGVLLQEAQNIRAVASAPWLLSPAVAIIVTVLALNFLGDGLRDAADPYGR
jgi:peptide/nickel transport system permease protein